MRFFTLHPSSCLGVGCVRSPSHVFIYAPGGSFSCRLDASRMSLCILFFAIITVKNISSSFLNIPITVYF
ncbi:hypothetical protein GDH60_21300 [Salmonella enterica subsp. enterica]|nr:hypothetical protein [Salmonella enterica subsp. enterica serovar Westminster]